MVLFFQEIHKNIYIMIWFVRWDINDRNIFLLLVKAMIFSKQYTAYSYSSPFVFFSQRFLVVQQYNISHTTTA